jgi:23S rRNA pseudouridine1911/1915/1917 synthase
MLHIGHPMFGDPVYAGKGMNTTPALRDMMKKFKRQALHATRLGLIHPDSGEAMEWSVDIPADMAQLLKELRSNAEE